MKYNLENPLDLEVILEFEKEIENWFKENENQSFIDYLIFQHCLLDKDTIIQRNLTLYDELRNKWSGLQQLRWLRKKHPNRIDLKTRSNEIDVALIPF